MKKVINLIINMFNGFCMALADSVPGVSGGTVAFLLGFYDDFINSLGNLMKRDKKGVKEINHQNKKNALIFLIKLGLGWGIGFISAVLVLSSVFETQIYNVSSLFIGFIIFAIPVVIMEEKTCLKDNLKYLFFIIIGALVVSLITYFNPVSGGESGVDLTQMNFGLAIYIFIVAMVAISAMVLPGISGSTLLLIFGLYMPIMAGIKEVLHLNFEYLPAVIIFGLGVITGVVLIIKLIQKCLDKFRPQTIYLIIGLMIGSIYSIVVGPTTLENAKPAMDFSSFSILFFIIGGVIIAGMQGVKTLLSKKEKTNNK
ncbi:MAG: DUF368 domain-containing protein [Clostridiales bacterium]|nr:DUF368 domain-containing protein [Clostridiales bacterium]